MPREMMILNAEDQRRLNELLDRRSPCGKRYMCLRTVVDDWRLLAGSLDSGYRLGFDAYTDDVSTRNLIQEVMDSMPKVAHEIEPIVEDADRHFLMSTNEDVRASKAFGASPKEWWKHRLPQRADHRFWEQVETVAGASPRD